MTLPDPAVLHHELTKHGTAIHPGGALVDFVPLDPANRPAPFKRYPDIATIPLPTELGTATVPAASVLSGQRPPDGGPVDALVLSRLLFLCGGVTRSRLSPGLGSRVWFRAAMSAGNLHPVEIYLVTADLPGVSAAVHHFAPLDFGLTPLRPGDWRASLAGAAAEPAAAAAPVSFVLTGIPWRTGWKYGERGWRHLYWDAGTLLANLLATAAALGLPARVLAGFADAEVAHLLGVDGVEEFPLVIVIVGQDEPASVAPEQPPPLRAATAPLSPRPLVFPLITEAQRGGALPDAAAVTAWRSGAGNVGELAGDEIETPPGIDGSSIEEVVLRRGSTRQMRRDSVALEVLTWGMSVAARPVPCDFTPTGRTLLQHWMSVHGVAGMESGTGRWRPGHFEVSGRGDVRAAAQQLCLGQPLGGDSAYTAFHCADLEPVLHALGSRGYRAAQLEAGVAAGRLALAAFTLHYGATGLTFFDEAVSAFFATPAACMLTTAVGVPAYRNRPGGGPGRPVEIAGFERLSPRTSVRPRGRER